MTRSASDSPGARALRRAGYLKSPSFWVTQEQYDMILWMAHQNKNDVDAIKEQAYGTTTQTDYQRHADRS